MSSDEQDAAILRIVKERAESRRRRTLLGNELQLLGRSLRDAGSSLANVNPGMDPEFLRAVAAKHEAALRGTPAGQMIEEYLSVSGRIAELDERARQLGID